MKDEPRFGGIMLWDASFDQNNHINGKIYSEHIAAMFNNGPPPTGKPVTLPPVTQGPTKKTTTHQPEKTTAAPPKTTKAPEKTTKAPQKTTKAPAEKTTKAPEPTSGPRPCK